MALRQPLMGQAVFRPILRLSRRSFSTTSRRQTPSAASSPEDAVIYPPLNHAATTIERIAQDSTIDESNPAFGTSFTDHMVTIPWTANAGWATPAIHQVRPLALHPATSSLHYAFQCFEGLKAYRSPRDGGVRLFRPDLNMARLNRAAARLCLPTFDPASAVEVLKAFVRTEERFVPSERGHALYLRPTLISTEPSFAMFAPRSALLYVLASPISTFYRGAGSGGPPAVTLSASPAYVRAFPAGIGSHKVGANYAPCFLPQLQAARGGHAQNLWLLPSPMDPSDYLLQEVGTMNLFVVLAHRGSNKLEIATPPLDRGTILPGVTRRSVLELARERLPADRFEVNERDVGIKELVTASKEGRLREIFGSGTAVVVAPVEGVEWDGSLVRTAGGTEVAAQLKTWLEEIQFGEVDSEWSVKVT